MAVPLGQHNQFRYMAWCKEYVLEEGDSLDALIDEILDAWTLDDGEDVAVWDGLSVVAVIQGTGGFANVVKLERPNRTNPTAATAPAA